MSDTAVLVLEDGSRYRGRALGALGTTLGEAVFSTGMTGYQETLTDPSYAGQIVVMTAPEIGNTGMNDTDMESGGVQVAGFVVREASRRYSNWRAQRSLGDDLAAAGIVSMSNIDTRAFTRHIRSAGAMRAGIFSGADADKTAEDQLAIVRAAPAMSGQNLSAQVSTDAVYTIAAEGERRGRVVVVDLGVKRATLHNLADRGYEVVVVPFDTSAVEIVRMQPDGVFFSNGPGDPAASDATVATLRAILDERIPLFGICFGNQLLGRALGFETYKLPFGHRGLNQPVLDVESGRVQITAQNHGFAVKADPGEELVSPNGYGAVEVAQIGLNDRVVEGLKCLDIPAFSVQYHPEATAGPHDANPLFDRFDQLIQQGAK